MTDRKLFAHELEARLDELLLLSLRQRSAAEPAALLEALPRELQERVLHWAGIAAQTSDDLGWLIASLAATQAAGLGPQLDDWVRAGLDAYDRSGLAATRKALNEFAEASKASALRSQDSVAFGAMEGRLSRFLHALDGRPLRLVSGPRTWTDTETLWLPERLDMAGDAAGNRRLYKVMAALLWAQTRFGTFNIDPEPELERWPARDQALAWLAVFEAMRLEACIGRELPGLAQEMAGLRGPWPPNLTAAAATLARPAATVADSLECMAGIRRVGAGDTPIFPYVGTLDPVAARRVRAARITRELAIVRRALNVIAATDSKAGAAENSDYPPLAAEGDMQVPDPQADLLALPPAAREAARSLMQDLGEIPPEALHAAGPGAWQPVDGVDDSAAPGVTTQPDAFYDEWDYRRGSWRHGWWTSTSPVRTSLRCFPASDLRLRRGSSTTVRNGARSHRWTSSGG